MTIKVNDRSKDFISMLFWLFVCLFWLQYLTGCTGQAYEFKIGFGQYSESKETRTFTKENKNERPL